MKHIIKRYQNTAIFLVKCFTMVLLFLSFFGCFSYIAPQLLLPTRTLLITVSTFAVAGLLMLRMYGGFAIGKSKSKDIVSTVALAVLFTDIITFLQLIIMVRFSLVGEYYMLLLVFVLQLIFTTVFTYFGNWLYFKINPPEKSILIFAEESEAANFLPKIRRYRRQWDVEMSIPYDVENLYKRLFPYQTVFLIGLPADVQRDITEMCYKYGKNIYFVPKLSDVIVRNTRSVVIDDKMTYASVVTGISSEQKAVKRTIDILIAGILTIITSPIMLICALAIKLCDHGPVFYRQRRITENGKPFDVIKFRTMIVDAEKESGMVWAAKNDSRITSVGKYLRKLRLDELPQLLNILKGDMSVVGPRPEREELIDEFCKTYPEFKYRLKVKAGLTGLAQIMGKYNTTPVDKLTMDLEYIENYSVWLDLKLILQTAKVFFKSDSTEGVDEDDTEEDSEENG